MQNLGEELSVSVNSEYAQCENCGISAEVDSGKLGAIRAVYESAQRRIRLNSAAGYKDTINQLQTIPFVSDTRLLATGGAIYIAVHLYRGDLSPKAVYGYYFGYISIRGLKKIGNIKS